MAVDRRPRLHTPAPRRDAIGQICTILAAEVKPILAITAAAIGDHGGTVDDIRKALNTALDELEDP